MENVIKTSEKEYDNVVNKFNKLMLHLAELITKELKE